MVFGFFGYYTIANIGFGYILGHSAGLTEGDAMAEFSIDSPVREPTDRAQRKRTPLLRAMEKGLGQIDGALLKLGRFLDPLPSLTQKFALDHVEPNYIVPEDIKPSNPIKGTVLVVGCIRERMLQIWEESNCQNCICLIAADSAEAVSMAKRIRIDAAFLSLNFPDLDGMSTARDIRRASAAPGIRIFAVRPEFDQATGLDSDTSEFDATLQMPLNEDGIRSVLTGCLR